MTRVSGFVCKDCGEPFSMDKKEIEFYENKGLQQPKRCPGCRVRRRDNRPKGCKCARPTDEYHGWRCTITDGECMYLIPDSKACARDYGEGPDS